MTEPTDNELDALLAEHWPAFATSGARPLHGMRAAMRDAIAKWGAPPVAGEPVAKERFSEPLARVIYAGYLLSNCAFNLAQRPGTEISIGTAQTLSDCRKEWDEACAAYKALPSTPQPTQAQAGAVPLTDGQAKEVLWSEHLRWMKAAGLDTEGMRPTGEWLDHWLTYVRAVERAHGIKGGQHGPA